MEVTGRVARDHDDAGTLPRQPLRRDPADARRCPVMTTTFPRMTGFDICLSDGPQKIPRLRAPLQRCPRDTFRPFLGNKNSGTSEGFHCSGPAAHRPRRIPHPFSASMLHGAMGSTQVRRSICVKARVFIPSPSGMHHLHES
jgi:hypothetical protein